MPSTRRSRFLVGLLLLGTLGASVPVAAETAAGATACTPRIDHVDRGEAVGDVLTVEMLHCFSSSVTISGPDYDATVRLDSEEYSGGVRVHLDTSASGASALSASPARFSDDELAVDATANGTVRPGTYEITVRYSDGDVAERVTVDLSEPTAKGVEMWRAPRGAAAGLDDPAAVRASRERSDVVDDEGPSDSPGQPTLDVATNETLVVALEASGLESAMASGEERPLARFREALSASSLTFEFLQTEETASPQRQLLRPDLLNSSATRLVSDAPNGTYYLVVDTRNLTAEWGGSHGETVHVGQRVGFGFRAGLWTQPGTDDPAQRDGEGADYVVVDADAEAARSGPDDRVAVAPGSKARVYARTTLAPGTSVTIVLERAGTLARVEAVVRENGTVVAKLPLDGVDPGNAPVRLDAHGRTLLTAPAVVSTPEASVSLPDQTPEDGQVRTRNLTTNRVAVLALYAGAGTTGEPLATRVVSPDASWDVTLSLANASENPPSNVTVALYADQNVDGELDAGEPLLATDRARLSQQSPAATPTSSVTPTPTSSLTPTASPISTPGQSETWSEATGSESPTRTTTPGFTLAGGLLALFFAGLLAARR